MSSCRATNGKLADAGKVVAVGKGVGAVGVWKVAAVEDEAIPDTLPAGEVVK